MEEFIQATQLSIGYTNDIVIARNCYGECLIVTRLQYQLQVSECTVLIESPDIVRQDGGMGAKLFCFGNIILPDVNERYNNKGREKK